MPPADSLKAAERTIEKEQQYTPSADSHKAAERNLEQDSAVGTWAVPAPGSDQPPSHPQTETGLHTEARLGRLSLRYVADS